ncbi:MAG: isocitrate lyase/PEP mutase family protein [Candidatus Tectomicrobia bacterium]|uniref:Isocitrate lyase/PEP mutase family protein n=1 Tax=Tectimicrobiota bacterium TaxID=2528274 RepID=A0A937W1D0_UNCTE|nr:isocitrate lyase/PEP mutase family protein [Candidatus Tectomicrobia bacterium]
MSLARERLRRVLQRPQCTVAANIFDPLSARIAHLLDYEVCFLSGSVGKAANLGVPDIILGNLSDLVDHCRRITRMADVSLMIDGEDGFGQAVNVLRSIRELEAAGVAAIEVEDQIAPTQFNGADPGILSTAEQIGKLEAAVAARTDPTTIIVARTAALAYCPLDDALDRMRAYAQTGVEMVRLVGLRTRQQLEAVHQAVALPLSVLSPPAELRDDTAFLSAHGVKIFMLGNPAYGVAVKAVYDCLKHLKDGGALEDLDAQQASSALLRAVDRTEELKQWQQRFLRA